jgi:hypothetical protein
VPSTLSLFPRFGRVDFRDHAVSCPTEASRVCPPGPITRSNKMRRYPRCPRMAEPVCHCCRHGRNGYFLQIPPFFSTIAGYGGGSTGIVSERSAKDGLAVRKSCRSSRVGSKRVWRRRNHFGESRKSQKYPEDLTSESGRLAFCLRHHLNAPARVGFPAETRWAAASEAVPTLSILRRNLF